MNHFFYLQYNISIDVTLQQNEGVILIELKYSNENKYSSFFNLENLKNIDILFGGSPLSEAYRILCDYFRENLVSIIEVSNSKIIFEIEKDIKPNMRFELKREKNIYNNKNEYNNENIIINNSINNIGNMNNNIKNQTFRENKNYNDKNDIGNINNKYFMNYSRNIYDFNNMDYNGNMNNNNNINYNGNMNNYYKKSINYIENNNNNYNGNMNYNNTKNYNNNYNNRNNNFYKNSNGYNNELINNMINQDMESLQLTENVGGVNIKIIGYNNNFLNKGNNSFYQNSINNNENNNYYLNEKQNQECSSFNVRVVQPKNNQRVDGQIIDLNCLLRFLFLKKMSNKNENISNFGNFKNVEEILNFFNTNQDSKVNKKSNKDNNSKDDKNSKEDKNILEYLENMDLNLNSLVDNLPKEKQELKNEIINYWKLLSKYEEYNNGFEPKLFEDLKNCHLDYSIVDMNILERDNSEEYEQKKKECKNMKKMILYFLPEMNSDFNKLNMELKYSNKSIYGRGFYFSDSIDYIVRCLNRENIPKICDNFSLLVCEIFYDEKKLKEFDIYLSSSNSSQNSSSSEEEKVEPNGLIKVNNCYLNDKKNSKRIINIEYVLSEKYQIFPLYKFTLRRNEFLVLYRDPNFMGKNKYSQYLKNIILKSLKYSNDMNFYFIGSTEEALKLLLKKKKEKVILITSIGIDQSGKRFVEIARKILKYDLIVLFFSNNKNHFNWIKDFSNCLYTNNSKIYVDYISNYKEDALKELKKKVEDIYEIKLKDFSFDFLCYSNCDDDLNSSYLDYKSICPYFRSVYIFNPNKNLYISMTKEGKVKKSEEKCIWEITLINNDITFFSNGFYLDIDKNKEIAIGSKSMKKWNLKIDDNCYYFFNSEGGKNNYLSMKDDEDIRINEKNPCKFSIFQLKDHI